jgi:hypothetical protein
LSCGGEPETGTLEIRMQNLDAVESHDLTMVVRVNAVEKRRLDNVPASFFIDEVHEGVVNIGIDFKNGAEVKFFGDEVRIEPNQIAIIEVDLDDVFPTTQVSRLTTQVGRLVVESAQFDPGEQENIDLKRSPDINTLKLSKGRAVSLVTAMIVKDRDGNEIDRFSVSLEYVFDWGSFAFSETDPDKNRLYYGEASGRTTIYKGRKEEGNILFKGDFYTDPPRAFQLVISPDEDIDRLDDLLKLLIDFEHKVGFDAKGEGEFENHLIKNGRYNVGPRGGTLIISMDALLYRER